MLALALMLGTGTTAMAANNNATITEDGGTAKATVTGTYVSGDNTVYKVDIVWGNLSFTYNEEAKGTWNPNTHTYSGGQAAGWAPGKVDITITNHSNTAVAATPSYEAAADEYKTADMQFSNSADKVIVKEKTNEDDITYISIGSADNQEGANGAGSPVKETFKVTPTGELPPGTKDQTIGTITITIDKLTNINAGLDGDWNGDINIGF